MSYKELVDSTRQTFETGRTKSLEFRTRALKNMLRMYEENVEEIVAVLKADLSKSRQESITGEVNVLTNEIRDFLINLKKWTSPDKPETGIANLFDEVSVIKEPYGVVLIIGTWNYPLQLLGAPAIGAIAAGNCVVMKPSEVAVETAKLMQKLVPKYLDKNCYKVVCGGPKETMELLEERFDYIFYTGSMAVGKIVHSMANKHLTPVTLELGGKSPVYIDSTANIEIAVRRILWGKFVNAGQTCIAPDYVLCSTDIQNKFLDYSKKVLKEFYGEDPIQSPDYCRIINSKQFDRLSKLLESSNISIGGKTDRDQKYISPTIVTETQPTDLIMQEEIFGPILPILTINSPDEAIDFIKSRERPLALYVFSENSKVVDRFLKETSSGGVLVNDTLMHFLTPSLPFGGIGYSGMGQYHGKYSFETFTHRKACLKKDLTKINDKMFSTRYPPYSDNKLNFLTMLLRRRRFMPGMWTLFFFGPLLLMIAIRIMLTFTEKPIK